MEWPYINYIKFISSTKAFFQKEKIHLRQMGREELGHGEGSHPVVAEHFGHLLVGEEVLLVLGVLEVVILQIGPKIFNTLPSGGGANSNNVGQVARDSHGLAESSSWHDELGFLYSFKE